MYKRIDFLCKEKGETITTMCKNLSISRSILSEYKAGRTKTIKADVLSRISAYLDTTIDYLLTGEQKESPPSISDEELGGLNIAFYGEAKQSLSDDDKDDIRALIEAKLKRNKEQGK